MEEDLRGAEAWESGERRKGQRGRGGGEAGHRPPKGRTEGPQQLGDAPSRPREISLEISVKVPSAWSHLSHVGGDGGNGGTERHTQR